MCERRKIMPITTKSSKAAVPAYRKPTNEARKHMTKAEAIEDNKNMAEKRARMAGTGEAFEAEVKEKKIAKTEAKTEAKTAKKTKK